jgi:hypothetical protein
MRKPLQAWRSLRLRTRWLITIAVYAGAIAAIAIAVRGGGGGGGSPGPSQAEAAAQAQADREGRIAIAQDEAPHTATLSPGTSLPDALRRAIGEDVHSRIAHGELTGPLQSVSCSASGTARGGRAPFDCSARSAGLSYAFLAVADERTRRLTWCKVDPPPEAGAPLEVPVSASCRA